MRCSRPTSGSPERRPGPAGALTARPPGPGLERGVGEGPSRAGGRACGGRDVWTLGPAVAGLRGVGGGEKGSRLGPVASARTGAGSRGRTGEVGGPSAPASVLALPVAVVCFAILLCAISPHCRVSSLRTGTGLLHLRVPPRGLHRRGLNVCCMNE